MCFSISGLKLCKYHQLLQYIMMRSHAVKQSQHLTEEINLDLQSVTMSPWMSHTHRVKSCVGLHHALEFRSALCSDVRCYT